VMYSIFIDVTDFTGCLFEGRVGAGFAQAQSEDEGEGVDEEKDPEGNDFNKEPLGAVLLGLLAQLAIFAEVAHVDNSVGY
jgi:hypothetical protein